MSFQDKLRRVEAFFKPENLKQTQMTVDKIPGDTALLVIDVQKEYCDPRKKRGTDETDRIAKRIQSIVPEFRKAGVPVYVVYFRKQNFFSKFHDIDFHHFTPEPDDMLVAKNMDSAFAGSNIGDILQQHGRTKILACGFNLNACVGRTVADAITNGFKASVIQDMVGNDKMNPEKHTLDVILVLKSRGADFCRSDKVLKEIFSASAGKSKSCVPAQKSKYAANKKAAC